MSDWIAAVLMLAGGFFCLVAGVGIVRMNDMYARMHGATKVAVAGILTVIVAAILYVVAPGIVNGILGNGCI